MKTTHGKLLLRCYRNYDRNGVWISDLDKQTFFDFKYFSLHFLVVFSIEIIEI